MLQEKLNNLGHTANMMVEHPSNRPLDIVTVTVNNLEKHLFSRIHITRRNGIPTETVLDAAEAVQQIVDSHS